VENSRPIVCSESFCMRFAIGCPCPDGLGPNFPPCYVVCTYDSWRLKGSKEHREGWGCARSCYTIKRQDEESFGGPARSSPRATATGVGCGASARGKRKITVHHCVAAVSRLELISRCVRMSCQGGTDEGSACGDGAAVAGAMARATPRRPGKSHAGFQRERASNLSNGSGMQRSSKRNSEAWRAHVPKVIDVLNENALLIPTEG
jgi:hypothetical protein